MRSHSYAAKLAMQLWMPPVSQKVHTCKSLRFPEATVLHAGMWH